MLPQRDRAPYARLAQHQDGALSPLRQEQRTVTHHLRSMKLLQRQYTRPAAATCLLLFGLYILFFWQPVNLLPTTRFKRVKQILREEADPTTLSNGPAVACIGPRGTLLSSSANEDLPAFVTQLKNTTFPIPTFGSYEALKLEKTWMTIEQRYGPYGYGEEKTSYRFSRVVWETLNWGLLQLECLEANNDRFAKHASLDITVPRFRFFGKGEDPKPPVVMVGRQAIVLRTWSTYEYHAEDLWNIRSTITEAALATGAEYQVFLLVDYKCGGRDECGAIHEHDAYYNEVLDDAVPKEFRHMAVLYHESLLESWYSQTLEHKPIMQIMQPLQLFAHFYPEFDHYWQIEMDARFTGDTGKILQAFSNFGKAQPYKQASERATWAFMSPVHGTYEQFAKAVDTALEGNATVWGAIKTKPIEPIGQDLSAMLPIDDHFRLGVGKDADLLLLSQMNEVNRIERFEDWVFKDWYYGGFEVDAPRFMSVPAQARASWDLLEAIHRSQNEKGLRIASEATLPSFALWNGLKVVGLPTPKWLFPERDTWELNYVQNGGMPTEFSDGMARGSATYRSTAVSFFSRPLTLDWWSTLCDPMFERWMGLPYKQPEEEEDESPRNPLYVQVPNEMPNYMTVVDGEVYMPNMMLHPRKSNSYRAPE